MADKKALERLKRLVPEINRRQGWLRDFRKKAGVQPGESLLERMDSMSPDELASLYPSPYKSHGTP